jgi:hypothetical protein
MSNRYYIGYCPFCEIQSPAILSIKWLSEKRECIWFISRLGILSPKLTADLVFASPRTIASLESQTKPSLAAPSLGFFLFCLGFWLGPMDFCFRKEPLRPVSHRQSLVWLRHPWAFFFSPNPQAGLGILGKEKSPVFFQKTRLCLIVGATGFEPVTLCL